MRRSIWATFGWKAVRGIICAVINGHFQNSLEGDLLQQGGTILLDQDQKIVFYHRKKGNFLSSLGEGQFVGELIFLTSEPINASIVAEQPTEYFSMQADKLKKLF
ncbi:MAG: Cyclic nucleotide-binding domain protein [Candidatus Scalindua brodae]|uniref:Cyclic nucleotide-binding domain protein n=1 Tax=Candidatus Scalindua brodae TaxID=237368 RepID=A0A0B0ELZ7_9BACT|nr:MAG: Cyclic nucleotide-binding domain protein [Candidatus Scalindua brodae]